MTNAFQIEIRPSVNDSRSALFLEKIRAGGFPDLKSVFVSDVYTVDKEFSDEDREKIAKMLTNPIVETFTLNLPNVEGEFDFALELGYLPGVTDNLGTTVIESVEDLLKTEFKLPEENVYSSQVLYLSGVSEEDALKIGEMFTNSLINSVRVGREIVIPKVKLGHASKVDKISLDLEDVALEEIGKRGVPNGDGTFRGPLALRMSYLKVIQDYFKKEGRDPTDIELETIAQTWSEHCKHTIFAEPIDEFEDGLYKSFIKRATANIRAAKGDKDFCVSVFSDNSGAIIFDENYLVTDKAETHNTPSALEPFGGAITGIVGVNRDALGFGLGAKPVINRYGYCFGDPETHPDFYRDEALTNPMLSPRNIMDGVVKGVNNGANESGIPSPQGFVYFDERYNGKPLVFVGTIGLIPREVAGKPSHEKGAKARDRIVMAGGRVGLDGIHGATFSSEALDKGSPSTAVQIGDPITQRKLSEVIVAEARDAALYNSITDCGAGGISSAIAEMARECGGCDVQLDKVPLKYPNLSPWEIWISESQERMTFSVPPEKVDEFILLLASRGVEAVDIGEFTDSGRCKVKFDGEVIMDLEMDFLHGGLPSEKITTKYTEPALEEPNLKFGDMNVAMLAMLRRKNICGFKYISRQYDHEVQGGSVLKPLQGPGLVNGTANVIRPVLESQKAVVTSQGLNPRFSDINTYAMAASSIDDAIAAAVAVGGNVDYMAIMDNFCWCSSDEEERLGQLKAAAQACYDYAVAFGTPYISGKDSMFNDFKGFDASGKAVKISIPPTLLVSALSVIPDANKVNSMYFKQDGDLIYLFGETNAELGGSEYFDMHGELGASVPQVDAESALSRYRAVFEAGQNDLFNSVIHVDKGGLGIALVKSAISGQMGAEISLVTELRADLELFSETKSRFLVSVSPANMDEFEERFPNAKRLGTVSDSGRVVVKGVLDLSLEELSEAYNSPFKNY